MSVRIWAGVECTINRVGSNFINQIAKSGHISRPGDLELFASLGIEKIRYPFLWEAFDDDWTWADQRIEALKNLNLDPIAGLLHHGSGPASTHLLDEEFPFKFAKYAERFARRYPWIEHYTPINEPLTTARFSGLYGFWYPHAKNDSVFVRILFLQIKAIVLAMKSIRKIKPAAKLVLTEDFGVAQSTEPLRYQIEFENQRRWLSFDLLLGRVNSEHYFYKYLIANGTKDSELAWLRENCVVPEIIGINHYHLSNRFLDHRLELYPYRVHGGNGRDRYVDVGAVDSDSVLMPLPQDIFLEVWKRYNLPIAVTEVHLNGSREAQMRWLNEIWEAANFLKKTHSVDFRAVTAWSLLGTYDWNSLCVNNCNYYESGVFDVRASSPRATALVPMIKSLAKNIKYDHPLLRDEGWWRRKKTLSERPSHSEVLVVTGATGTLGQAFHRICEWRGIPHVLLTRSDLDIGDLDQISKMFANLKPWAIVNAAGYVNVDRAEVEREKCFRDNVLGPENLARACFEHKVRFLSFSSDLVFDGCVNTPYFESHPVSPLNVYGESKAEAEKRVLSIHPESLLVRTSSFFGPWDEVNFITESLRRLKRGEEVSAANDVTISPTYIPDLVHSCLNLLIDNEKGILHLTNSGQITWADFAYLAARKIGVDGVRPLPFMELNLPAKRPSFSALDSRRAKILPPFQEALERYFYDRGDLP